MSDYTLMIDAGDYTYRHLRDEGTIYTFESGHGFVDKLDVARFGWTVRTMDDPALPEEQDNDPALLSDVTIYGAGSQ